MLATTTTDEPMSPPRLPDPTDRTLLVRMPTTSLAEILVRVWTNALAVAIHDGHRDSPPRAGQDTPSGLRQQAAAPGGPIVHEIRQHDNRARRAETERHDLIRRELDLRRDADQAADRGALDVRAQLHREADHQRLLAGFTLNRSLEQRRLIARKMTELTELRHNVRRPTDGPYVLRLPRLLVDAADTPRGTFQPGLELPPQTARVTITDDDWNELTTWCLRRNDDGPERQPTLERAIYRLQHGRLFAIENAFTVSVFRRIIRRATGVSPSQGA